MGIHGGVHDHVSVDVEYALARVGLLLQQVLLRHAARGRAGAMQCQKHVGRLSHEQLEHVLAEKK